MVMGNRRAGIEHGLEVVEGKEAEERSWRVIHGAKPVVMSDGIIGCPHEEGIDYPDGQVCPQCPYWAHRDRWTGDVVQ
jgi:hypothetical protein